jgi:DNA primase
VEAAEIVRDLLQSLGLTGFLKTTGGKGLHVAVPIEPKLGWDEVKGFSKAVAELLARAFSDRFTALLSKVRLAKGRSTWISCAMPPGQPLSPLIRHGPNQTPRSQLQ